MALQKNYYNLFPVKYKHSIGIYFYFQSFSPLGPRTGLSSFQKTTPFILVTK
ncbi:hypothetical protein LEP1GSC127_0320 [Leptospira kirschneri str. 200801925]|nr:hypothetical protein LEP1GSC127_0320 [Leptospira kirschneri str. 200801925]